VSVTNYENWIAVVRRLKTTDLNVCLNFYIAVIIFITGRRLGKDTIGHIKFVKVTSVYVTTINKKFEAEPIQSAFLLYTVYF
jgi:hypothetical protein